MSRIDDQPRITPERASVPDRHWWRAVPLAGWAIGMIGAGVSLMVARTEPQQFYFSYLVAFIFFLSIALGGLFFVLIQYATRASWGISVRRTAENAMATLPLFILLFIPVLFGMHELFHWTHEDAVAHDALLQHKEPYLNSGFFMVRAALYFAAWTLLSMFYYRLSVRQDETGDERATRRLNTWSGVGIIVFGLTTTFASVDWIMSLDPHWYSTILGVYFFSGTAVAIMGFLIVSGIVMQSGGLVRDLLTAEHFHDLGKLLFGFTVFWSYIGFSQYFLIWYGNIPEETVWYIHRTEGSWMDVSKLLAVGHFLLPFFFLMPRSIKRRRPLLFVGALWMLAMHWVDLYWMIMPVLHHEGAQVGLADAAAMFAVGGLFIGTFAWLTQRHALVPIRDPRIHEALGFENV
ncbi:MAG: quinol:cytochrome C oxidoreductase [Acidobacteriota bacterium]|nr:quinol:cytochrome C oxidoreductase [Acidobacteriota bacterium]